MFKLLTAKNARVELVGSHRTTAKKNLHEIKDQSTLQCVSGGASFMEPYSVVGTNTVGPSDKFTEAY